MISTFQNRGTTTGDVPIPDGRDDRCLRKTGGLQGLPSLLLHDGAGRRVSKVGSKLYWYGSGGEILAETNTNGNATAEYNGLE